jgi:hypothetical protein
MNPKVDRALSPYAWLLGVVAVLMLLFLLWAVDKGFDITDEGLYLLVYRYPVEYSNAGVTFFHLIISKLLSAESVSIIGYRLAGLAAGILSALLLAGGLWHWLNRNGKTTALSFWLLFGTFVIGSFLHYSILPRTISYNDLFVNSLVDIDYWLAVLCIVFVGMPAELRQKLAVRVLAFVLPGLLIAEQVGYGLLAAPYLQAAGLEQQNTPFAFDKAPIPAVLQLDARTAAFMTRLTQALQQAGFRPGMPIIAAYDMPGLVYMLGGVYPGNPWFFGQQDRRNCDAFEKTGLPLTQAFMLVNEPPGPELLACMKSHGLNFPQDYKVVGSLLNPYCPNQYNWRNYQDTLTVYAPLALQPLTKLPN